jgi:hypothetical protein
MRDEASLRRLAEMGVDVYLPRAVMTRVADAIVVVAAEAQLAGGAARSAHASPMEEAANTANVLLLADIDSPRTKTLLADVVRTLKFAHVSCAHAGVRDEAALSVAAGLVMFGEVHARAVGALLTAQRQGEIGWVVSAEPNKLAGSAQAKRALWSELRRMTRQLASGRRQTLAMAATGPDLRKH